MKNGFLATLVGLAAFTLCLVASSASALTIEYHTPTSGLGVTASEYTIPINDYGANYINNRKDGDFGDAPGYAVAEHGNSQWQGLGIDADIDDGVLWSVDGGTTFNNTSALTAGQNAIFKFSFWQANNGRHDYDQILASFDSNQNGIFEAHDETLLYARIFTSDQIYSGADKDTTLENARFIEFLYTMTIDEHMSGEAWLRVRSTCWDGDDLFPDFLPSGYALQGETEDYLLTINPVPEPGTMLLFGTGLVGLVGFSRRKKK